MVFKTAKFALSWYESLNKVDSLIRPMSLVHHPGGSGPLERSRVEDTATTRLTLTVRWNTRMAQRPWFMHDMGEVHLWTRRRHRPVAIPLLC